MTSLITRLRRLRMRTGVNGIEGQSPTVETGSVTVEAGSFAAQKASKSKQGASVRIDNPVQVVENETPDKPHLRRPRKIGRLERRITRIRHFWKPQPTPAELELIEQRKYNERIYRNMVREMMTADKRIVNTLANLGFEYIRVNRKDKFESTRICRVHFSRWVYSNEGNTIYGRVDQTPYGVSKFDLISDRVLTELSASLGHPVDGKLDENGLIYWVSLAGRNDFVDRIMWREMLPKVPKTALPLTFIVGATKNGGREWRNLESLPHMLGAGEPGSGKTVFMHNLICTFISRNTPANVRLLMIDVKFGGISLNKYKGIPHLLKIETPPSEGLPPVPDGIANDNIHATSILAWALAESTQRGEMFLTDKKHHPEKIEQWNRYHPSKHLPRIVIVADELALLMDKGDVDSKEELAVIKQARFYIKNILRLARSSGVHLLGFTQVLDKSVMGVAFKTNVAGRICFAVGDATASTLVVGDGCAVNLLPAGRAVYKRGTDKFMVQTPLIEEPDIAECVRNAKAGKILVELVKKTVTPVELIRFAIDEGNYSLNRDKLYEHFRGQVSFNKLNTVILPGMERQIYDVDGEKYTVIPGPGGNLSRRVERLEEGKYTAVLADHPTIPPIPQAKKPKVFEGECPECGAPRTQTPCEYCDSTRLK